MVPLLLLVFILLLSSAVLVYPFSSCRLSCSSCCCKGYHHHHLLCSSHVKNIITSSYNTDHQYGCSPRDSSLFPLFAADNSEETPDSDLTIEDTDSTSSTDETDDAKSNDVDVALPSPPKYLSSGYKLATSTSILSGLLLIVNIGTISSSSMSPFSVLSLSEQELLTYRLSR